MNAKTPISILQELAVQRGYPSPVYDETGAGGGSNFTCYCRIKGVTARGTGSSKKAAKQDAALKALLSLQNGTVQSESVPIKQAVPVAHITPLLGGNYVGELNELVTKSSLPFPIYEPSCLTNGMFVMQCRLGNETALGQGFTKKDAKQDAARNMLKQLKEGPTKLITNLGNFVRAKQKVEMDEKNMKEIIGLFKILSAGKSPQSASSETDFLEPDSGVKIDTDSIEEIESMLNELGILYTISDFSVKDGQYIVYLVIRNSDMTLMGMGSTRKQAILDVLKRTLVLKKLGCSFAFKTL